ncbi:hypothetical protein [Pseudomonas brassicacearum]|uniref:hypothetical protein n=1 Tax=Pseudomonas brassicacearum TaxID=930166 RepID=UPI001BDE6018|nr:hypothetical protein [Pseudomonas brassicacearum]
MAHTIRSEQARSNASVFGTLQAQTYPIDEVGFDIGCVGFCVQGFHRERGIKRFMTHEMGRTDAQLALELLIPEVPEAELSLSAKGFFSQEVPEFERTASIMRAIVRSAKYEARPGRFILEAVGWYGQAAKDMAKPIWMPVWSADQ